MDKQKTMSEEDVAKLRQGTAATKQQKMLERIKYFEARRSPLESFVETFASKFVATVLGVKKTVEEQVAPDKMAKFWNAWTEIMLGF